VRTGGRTNRVLAGIVAESVASIQTCAGFEARGSESGRQGRNASPWPRSEDGLARSSTRSSGSRTSPPLTPSITAATRTSHPRKLRRSRSYSRDSCRQGAVGSTRRALKSRWAFADILVVAPYNAHVRALTSALPAGSRVGTVDKFQGQEAPVVIYSMATSTSMRRAGWSPSTTLTASTWRSRAQCLAVVVASPALLRPSCRTPRQMMQASGLCAAIEAAAQHAKSAGECAVEHSCCSGR